MDEATRRFVRARAADQCEYFQLPQRLSPVARLQIEHIIPHKHGGTDEEENLALACVDYNLHKGTNLTGIDPQTGNIITLFNPRTQRWSDHFLWDGVVIFGLTDVGRTTVRVLNLNSDERVEFREALL